MKQAIYVLLGIIIVIFASCNIDTNKEITTYVDTFIGTGGHGHTYPGASMPFGMVQLSPDTRIEGWDGCSGYHNSDNIVYGFSHTHLSGTGVGDYCDILFMPQLGDTKFNSGYETNVDKGYASRFSKKNEKASPGYYSTYLDDYDIKAELTCSKRVGSHKYTYPKNKKQSIIIDLTHRDEVFKSSIKIINDSTIAGMRISRSWAQNQYIYFYAQFSKTITDYKIAINDTVQTNISEVNNKNIKLIINFGNTAGNTVLSKVAISSVSIDGAKKNLENEIQGWDFEKTREQSKTEWNKELQKIKIEGTKKQKTIFYTSLYHSLLSPNLFMDVDGKYRGTDLKIHQANDFTNYTVFSLWDTYRATHPLFTIIDQKRTTDFIKTFLNQYKNGGQLPVWELAANYTGCMIGYHSVPVIVDAYSKGIKAYDINIAYQAMRNSAMQNHLGLDTYKKYGFISGHLEHESVSKTLEYAYDDWCIALIAKDLNKTEDYKMFIERAQSFKNIFDTKTGFMRPKHYGLWKYPFNPSEVDFNYTEANSWQYSFYVPQDISGLIHLLGGNTNFVNKLDSLFLANPQTKGRTQADITGLIGQYAHGNEPSHHMAYLYNFAQKPWKTQERVNTILTKLYTDKPDGLCGNEDCGQMSSWYIFSSLGFYPVTPGSEIYIIGLPIHKKAIINLENGNAFIIKSNYSKKNRYIKSVTLNGKNYTKSYIEHKDIMTGGEMIFEMSSKPNKTWGVGENNYPISKISKNKIVPVPYSNLKNRNFKNKVSFNLKSIVENSQIFYSINSDKNIFEQYTEALKLSETTTIYAYTAKNNISSDTVCFELIKFPEGRTIELINKYHPQYSAGNNNALIDGIQGNNDFRLGTWQGYYGVDLIAIVELDKKQKISELSIRFLQDIDSWIFMPEKVSFYSSGNGTDFELIDEIKTDVPEDKWGVVIKEYKINCKSLNTKYIKLIAKSGVYCPDWHKGHDSKLFIFADEILIK